MKFVYRLEYFPTKKEIMEAEESIRMENSNARAIMKKPDEFKDWIIAHLGIFKRILARKKLRTKDIEQATYSLADIDFIKSFEVRDEFATVEIDDMWVRQLKSVVFIKKMSDQFFEYYKRAFGMALTREKSEGGQKAIFLRMEE